MNPILTLVTDPPRNPSWVGIQWPETPTTITPSPRITNAPDLPQNEEVLFNFSYSLDLRLEFIQLEALHLPPYPRSRRDAFKAPSAGLCTCCTGQGPSNRCTWQAPPGNALPFLLSEIWILSSTTHVRQKPRAIRSHNNTNEALGASHCGDGLPTILHHVGTSSCPKLVAGQTDDTPSQETRNGWPPQQNTAHFPSLRSSGKCGQAW